MLRPRIGKRKRRDSYTKMMKTLLLQNQQIIIQQQNMMFMVIKQFQQNPSDQQQPQHSSQLSQPQSIQQQLHPNNQPQIQQQQQQLQSQQLSQQTVPQNQQQQSSQQAQQRDHHHLQQQHHIIVEQSQQIYSQNSATMDTQQTMQQVASQLQQHEHENLSSYLTPAASEQDPISDDKQDEDDLAILLNGDGLLPNNLLYNPQTDIGAVTPYKNQPQQQQTPSYYSSGCESLTTPRVEHHRQPTTNNISQNVVKNLADSFKSPTKPKINVQILSSSARGSIKNSKAKIIQRMNISEFLRHVHPEKET